MNHKCEHIKRNGRQCGKIALWCKGGAHVCKTHAKVNAGVSVLHSSSNVLTMTNAKKVAVWKNPPGQPDTFIFDKVIKL